MSNVPPQSKESAPAVKPSGGTITFRGYAWGMRQPSLQYAVHCGRANAEGLAELDAVLSRVLGPDAAALVPQRTGHAVVDRLLSWPTAVLRAGSHPVLQPANAYAVQRDGAMLHRIQQPCLQHGGATNAVNFVMKAINAFAAGVSNAKAQLNLEADLANLLKGLKHTGLRGFNPTWFLSAAHELDVPWTHVRGDIFLFGWGARARWLQSSFTDRTSRIGTNLARNKLDGAAVLRNNGVPVPVHVSVHSEREAMGAAEKMGYPVVVKPVDLDGGKGVWVNLRNAAAVREAYANAFALSKLILVEKHVDGRDFRIQVVNGEVQGVVERVPGGVTGNGADSVRTLLERQNDERKHAADDRRFLHEIADDKEALGLLVEQDLDWDSIPGAGRIVRLRSASNVASGGVPTPVSLDDAHPDNLALAIRATRLLRLDVAGVDLLIPDITRSWLEGGAFICEVNAQPQMFTTMHKPMLASILGGTNGRIPVVIVVSAQPAADGAGVALHRALLSRGVSAGLVRGSHVHVGEQVVSKDAAGAFAGARMLCNDPSVQALVICVSDRGIFSQGWPVDRCDLLILDTRPPPPGAGSSPIDGPFWLDFGAPLRPSRVLVDESDALLLARAKALFGTGSAVESIALGMPAALDAGVVDTLLATQGGSKP